ncbi:aminotransferase class V-fold PLP-dependent enzyme [Bacteriovorax sp. DB6_IX]|uniref:aminotransferase class V-fold PLP-dependent enzyme n=1 Tax=Bacteriovorax sp. DB6_IX TaxID=1353530 RepID=UPI00038A2A26|nr:aminotransferase class V-fold PLP-dependent enzyme [Bacteriovorax sp. DB6_IX]EQC51493.1 putative phosphoserine transaminase [Bacteriovorax sp. DB6_IX]
MFENFNVPQELRPTDPRFGSGPSLVPVEFMTKLAETGTELLGTSHRKPAVKNLVKEMQEGLRKFFNVPADYEIVIGNGGATFLFDMIGLGLVRKKSSHFTCGEFSTKWYKSHANIPWIEAENIASEYGQGCSPANVEGSDFIAMTLNETSTGVQTIELPQVDDDTILAIDATSGAGQIPCDISKCDVFFFSPQKVFAAEGGFFVSIMSPKALKRAEEIAATDRYIPTIMSWELAITNSVKNQTYNTPSIATIFFLNEQVKLMNSQGGFTHAIDYAKKKADMIYNWANEKDYLSPYVPNEADRSIAVATIDVDDKYPAGDLIKVLEAQKAVYGIDAYRKLGKNQFRISLFHNVSYEDLVKLTKIIDLAIEQA